MTQSLLLVGAPVIATVLLPLAVYATLGRRRRWPVVSLLPLIFLAAAVGVAVTFFVDHALSREYLRALDVLLIPLELCALGYAGVVTARTLRGLRADRRGDFRDRLHASLQSALGAHWLTAVLATEAAVLYYALAHGPRQEGSPLRQAEPGPSSDAPASETFTTRDAGGYSALFPVLALAITVETVVLHAVVRHWNGRAAWVLATLSAYTLLWLVADYRAVGRRVLEVDDGEISIRSGLRWNILLPLAQIQRVIPYEPSARADRKQYRTAVVFGRPQFVLELREPQAAHGAYGRLRLVRRLGISVDDPERLIATLRRLLPERVAVELADVVAAEKLARQGVDIYDRLHDAFSAALPAPVASGAAKELSLLAYAVATGRPRAVDSDRSVFTYHKNGGYGTVLAGLLGIGCIEIAVMHLFVRDWSPFGAWVLTGLGLYGMLWLHGDYQAMRRRPIRLDATTLHLNIGLRRNLKVPLSQIAGLSRPKPASLPRRAPGYLRCTPLGDPTLLIELREPLAVTGRRGGGVTRIGVFVDDLPAFERALAQGSSRSAPREPRPEQAGAVV